MHLKGCFERDHFIIVVWKLQYVFLESKSQSSEFYMPNCTDFTSRDQVFKHFLLLL